MSRMIQAVIASVLLLSMSTTFAAKTALPSGRAYVDLFKLYIDKQNPDLKKLQTEKRYNLIHLGIVINDAKLVEAAINTGIDINGQTKSGLTPLHIAVGLQSETMTKLLLNYHARVNLAEEKGVTPLHLAAGYGNPNIVQLLLDHHADVNAMDTHGATPITFAQTEDHQQVKHMLISAGAKPRNHSVIEENRAGNVSIKLPVDDPLIKHQISLAQSQLPKFWRLTKRFPQSASVKFMLTLQNGTQHHVWANVKKVHAQTLDVELIAPPKDAATHHTINKNQIDDWQIELPNGKIRGQYSNQALLKAVERELGYLPIAFQEVADAMMDYH